MKRVNTVVRIRLNVGEIVVYTDLLLLLYFVRMMKIFIKGLFDTIDLIKVQVRVRKKLARGSEGRQRISIRDVGREAISART